MDSKKQAGAAVFAAHPTAKAGELYPPECVAAASHEMAKDNPRARRLAKVITPAVVVVWLGWLDAGKSIEWIRQNNELLPLTFETVQRYIDKHRAAAERIRASQNGQSAASGTNTPAPATVETAVSPPLPLAADPIQPPAQTTALPAADLQALPETAVPEPGPTAAAGPLPKPEIETMETAVGAFVPQKPDGLPPWLDRDYQPPRPSPGTALAALAALMDNEQLSVKGSVQLNLEIKFGGE